MADARQPGPVQQAILSSGTLRTWLAQVQAAGLPVSTHEALSCHLLWWRLAWLGRLPQMLPDRLRLLGAVLCHTPEQQRHYQSLLAEQAAGIEGNLGNTASPPQDEVRQRDAQSGSSTTQGTSSFHRRWLAWGAGMLLLLAGVWWWAQLWLSEKDNALIAPNPASSVPPPEPTPSASLSVPPAIVVSQPTLAQPAYVPPGPSVPSEPEKPALGWLAALRWILVGVGTLAALLGTWRLWRQWRRSRLFAQAAELLEDSVVQHTLHDPQSQPVRPRHTVLRPVATAMRQQMHGGRQRLDVRASIQATLRSGGNWTPRFAATKVTPEYLALIERAGPRDLQARFHEAMVAALEAQGVTLQVFYYRGSPQQGCWRLAPADAHGQRVSLDHMGFSTLVAYYSHHRLLVFGDTRASHNPDTGQLLPWLEQVRQFEHRAWFTPTPLPSWGELEYWLASNEGPDFLLLPMEEAALPTLAGWLSSGRALLTPHPRGPLRYPSLLAGLGQEQLWAFRQREPSAHELRLLMVQLRAYMGEQRMAWLAACAIFPALSWPLTLGLGRQVLAHQAAQPGTEAHDVEAELALGLGILAALPWFRHGRMPDWLRQHLLADSVLNTGLQSTLRTWLEHYLAMPTLQKIQGEEIARLARPKLATLLRGAQGHLRDVLLLRFMEPALAHPLLARLPETLRHLLFPNGLVLLGLRPTVSWGLNVSAALVLLALPPVWRLTDSLDRSTTRVIQPRPAPPSASNATPPNTAIASNAALPVAAVAGSETAAARTQPTTTVASNVALSTTEAVPSIIEINTASSPNEAASQPNDNSNFFDSTHDSITNRISLGDIQRARGNLSEARLNFSAALDLAAILKKSDPSNYRLYVATALSKLGDINVAEGAHPQALAAYTEALSTYSQLAQANPSAHLPDVATTLNNLGNLYVAENRYSQALTAYEEALAIYRQLTQVNPRAYLSDVATTLTNLGTLHATENRRPQALAAYEEALSIYKSFAKVSPGGFGRYVQTVENNIRDLQSSAP